MNLLHFPWLDLSIALALVGALRVRWTRAPDRAAGWGMVFTGLVFASTFGAWLAFERGVPPEVQARWSPEPALFGRQVLALDEFSAPLVPAIALLHFLTALATARTKMRLFSSSWSLTSEAIRLAMFGCAEPWPLIGLLALMTVPPYLELKNRDRPTRVYVIHMGLFLVLLVAGWAGVSTAGAGTNPPAWALALLVVAILILCATVPAHCWLIDWFEHASIGNALLYVAPLGGVYAAMRLVLPIGPDWALRSLGLVSLVTALYAAGMAVVQRESRRFFAYLFLSHASLVLVGLLLHTELSLTASLCLWFSTLLSLGGFGLTLRAIESRFGRLSLADYHGLYEHTPVLAVFFLLTGLASVGFPGTVGFISTELLVHSAVGASSLVGVGVLATAALNGIAVVRAYVHLFTGARHVSTVWLGIVPRERFAVLTLSALILGGGLFPQPGVLNRRRAADAILRDRARRAPASPASPVEREIPIHHPAPATRRHLGDPIRVEL